MSIDSLLDLVGWTGSIAFSVAAIPQAYEAYKKKACHINRLFLALWAVGEVCTLVYSIHIMALPLIMNYVINGFSLAVIIYYNKSMGDNSETQYSQEIT